MNLKNIQARKLLSILIGLTALLFLNFEVKGQIVTPDFSYVQFCDSVEFTNTSIIAPADYVDSVRWYFGDNTSTLILLGNSFDINHTYPVEGNYSVVFTLYFGNPVDSVSAIDTIHYLSSIAGFEFDQECDFVTFSDTSVLLSNCEIESVRWYFGDGTSQLIPAPLPFNTTHTYSVEGTYQIDYSIYFNSTDSSTASQTLNYFTPNAAFSFNQFCDSVELIDLSTSTLTMDSAYWYIDGTILKINNSTPPFNATYTFTSPGDYPVKLEIFGEGGCSDTTTNTVHIPLVTPNFIIEYFCDSVSFKDDSSPLEDIDSVFWSFGDGAEGFSFISPFDTSHIYSSQGNYDVQMITYSFGCTDTLQKFVYIEYPVAGFLADTACFGYETQLNDTSVTAVSPVYSWLWNYDDGGSDITQNPQHIFNSPGFHDVELVVTNDHGCIDTTNHNIFVDSVPLPDFSFNTVCFGDTTFFSNLTDTLNIFNDLSWEWHFGDPGSGLNDTSYLFEPSHIFSKEGESDVTLFVKNNHGCIDSVTYSVLVDSVPEANFSFQDVSIGNEAVFHDLSQAHGYPFHSYLWDFGDGETSTEMGDVTHIYDTIGKFQVCLEVTQYNSAFEMGCSNTYCDSIEVTTRPLADFDYTSGLTLFTQFTDKSIPPEGVGLMEWYWNFGDLTTAFDTSTLQNPYYSYPDTGYYNVYLQVIDSNGGVKDTTKQIYVGSAVIAKFLYQDVCYGDSVIFVDESYSPVEAQILEWQWDFGDGTDSTYTDTLEYITHYYDTTGVYYVSLIITTEYWGDTIRDTTVNAVYVHNLPIAEFDSVNACKGIQMQFIDLSLSIDTLSMWLWDFDDGTTSTNQNPYHLYADTGIYNVKLTVVTQYGCSDTISRNCVVSYAPIVTFQVENNCLNSPAYFIPVYDSTFTKITSWNWNFGDPVSDTANPNTSTDPDPSHIYSVISSYQVTMTAASYGCPKTVKKSFLVYPIPYSEFDLSENYNGVQGKTTFTNESIYSKTYLWDFGNGNTSTIENPIEVYEEDSLYTVTLISYNEYGCSDTSRHEVNVLFKGLYCPTAFSPNNPNEEIRYFEPKGVNLIDFHIYVYDTKGNKVWESDKLDELGSPAEYWDGYYNGVLQPQGTYVWKAYGVFRDGTGWVGSTLQSKEPISSGTVTLIR
jgi:PKD repeat protein